MTLFVGLFAAVTVLGWFGLEFARQRAAGRGPDGLQAGAFALHLDLGVSRILEPESLRGPQHSHACRAGAEGDVRQRSPVAA